MHDIPSDTYTLQLPRSMQSAYADVHRLIALRDWSRAQEAAQRLHRAAPESIPILLVASMVMLNTGRYREARSLLLQAAARPINMRGLLPQVVRLLRRFEEPEALQRVVKTSRWDDVPVPALAELALHLGSSGLYVLALECVEHAFKYSPDDPNLHYLRGLFEMFSGNTEASIEACERALAIRPGMPNTHLLLSMQDSVRSPERHISEMRHALKATRSGSEGEAYLCYSLHQRLDALGRYDEAWQVLVRGHAALRRMVPYRREEQHELFCALKRLRLPQFQPEPAAAEQTGLIFIIGMFRSGTSLLERILAGHRDIADGGETYQLSACMREAANHDCMHAVDTTIVARAPCVDYASVRRRMLAYATWRSGGRKWLTEKLPSNFLNVGFILHAFPDAVILHMRRDPVDTCFSNLRTLFIGAAPYACDQEDLADYYIRYRDLMAHWRRVAPGRIIDVDYSSFVTDPADETRRILAHCGLEFRPEILDTARPGGTVATASAASARGSIRPREKAWKPYEEQLQPMIRGLECADPD